MSNITQQDKRLAEIETLAIIPAAEIAARTRLSAALRRVGSPDNWTPPAGSKAVPVPPTSLEDRLRAGRSRVAQAGGPAAQIAAPAPVTPTHPAEVLPVLSGDAVAVSDPVPAVPLDREALFAAFAKSARGNWQTVDICNFNAAFATARATGTAFVAPPLAPVKRADGALAVDPGTQYVPYEDLA